MAEHRQPSATGTPSIAGPGPGARVVYLGDHPTVAAPDRPHTRGGAQSRTTGARDAIAALVSGAGHDEPGPMRGTGWRAARPPISGGVLAAVGRLRNDA